ncbi:hypothetical protein KI387_027823, partial [Taxus chinensis]
MGNYCSSSEQDESMAALDKIMKSIPDSATSLQKASTLASSSSFGIALESMSSMASTMRFAAQIRLDPALSGDLNLHKDEEGIKSVKVTLKNDDFKSRSVDKKMLNDPAFMPRIRS